MPGATIGLLQSIYKGEKNSGTHNRISQMTSIEDLNCADIDCDQPNVGEKMILLQEYSVKGFEQVKCYEKATYNDNSKRQVQKAIFCVNIRSAMFCTVDIFLNTK